ncbi:MAG: PIN domain-containing protein [SAR324 cluster bacterium]|nr:PIN domain-containing protein [SAR324 cluster bacterium]
MNGKAFFDTNIILYLYSEDEPEKQRASIKIATTYLFPTISTQVINELTNILFRKMQVKWDIIEEVITEVEQAFTIEVVTISVIRMACNIAKRYQYSYYDSVIIASALSCGCTLLISEDMQHGQIIENQLRIMNPFI